MSRKLRVLVVDDSAHNRRTIADILDSHPDIEVVGMADDGEKALKAAAVLKPDLITLDLEMPRMDGFTFLRIVMAQMPTPIIVVSSESRKQSVFQVLELGALDFIAKPSRYFSSDEAGLREQIISKALAVSALQIAPLVHRGRASTRGRDAETPPPRPDVAEVRRVQPVGDVERVVCIGASTGGPPALQSILKSVSLAPNAAIVVAQHMPEKFTRAFAERLNRLSTLHIQEAEDGAELKSANVYIAPGGAHTAIARVSANRWELRVTPAGVNDRYAPSIDLLFESAADTLGVAALAIVLTGMGSDGSAGVRAMRAAGGRCMAESQDTAIVYGMPKEAQQTGCVDEVLPLDLLAERIVSFCRGVGGT